MIYRRTDAGQVHPPDNRWVRIGTPVSGGEDVLLYLEAGGQPGDHGETRRSASPTW